MNEDVFRVKVDSNPYTTRYYEGEVYIIPMGWDEAEVYIAQEYPKKYIRIEWDDMQKQLAELDVRYEDDDAFAELAGCLTRIANDEDALVRATPRGLIESFCSCAVGAKSMEKVEYNGVLRMKNVIKFIGKKETI